jgi:T5orf172 domain
MPRRFIPRKPTPYKPFEDDCSAAYIYLLTNSAFRYIKIGFTQRSPKERAKEITSATGVPGEFKVYRDWFVPSDRARKLERDIHDELKRLRYHHKKELFRLEPNRAAQIIDRILEQNDLLELSKEKEEARLQKLREYYDGKKREAKLQQDKKERETRNLRDEEDLRQFRLVLHHRLRRRHKVRTEYGPVGVGVASAVLSLATIYAVGVSVPWILQLLILIGAYMLAHGWFDDRGSAYISRTYGPLIEQRVTLARHYLSQTNERVDRFIDTEKGASLSRVD